MKTITLSCLLFAISFTGNAQIADAAGAVSDILGVKPPEQVHDRMATLNLVKGLEEARKTYTAIEKQLELLGKARDAMEKVNNVVREVRYIDEIYQIYDKTIELNQKSIDVAQTLNVINDEYIISLIGSINNSLISFESTLNLATHLIKDDFFKMNDAERLGRMIEIRNETRNYWVTAMYLNREIRRYASIKFLGQIYNRALPYTAYKIKK
jgi:hypothetical protein